MSPYRCVLSPTELSNAVSLSSNLGTSSIEELSSSVLSARFVVSLSIAFLFILGRRLSDAVLDGYSNIAGKRVRNTRKLPPGRCPRIPRRLLTRSLVSSSFGTLKKGGDTRAY